MRAFDTSERSVWRWMRRPPTPADPTQRWLTFLRNHREAIAAIDFFTVPTIAFDVLSVFFIISHDRRRVLHLNVTYHPTSLWIVQQLREAFPFEPSAKFLILDHDAKYGTEVRQHCGRWRSRRSAQRSAALGRTAWLSGSLATAVGSHWTT